MKPAITILLGLNALYSIAQVDMPAYKLDWATLNYNCLDYYPNLANQMSLWEDLEYKMCTDGQDKVFIFGRLPYSNDEVNKWVYLLENANQNWPFERINNESAFIACIDTSGVFQWARVMSGIDRIYDPEQAKTGIDFYFDPHRETVNLYTPSIPSEGIYINYELHPLSTGADSYGSALISFKTNGEVNRLSKVGVVNFNPMISNSSGKRAIATVLNNAKLLAILGDSDVVESYIPINIGAILGHDETNNKFIDQNYQEFEWVGDNITRVKTYQNVLPFQGYTTFYQKMISDKNDGWYYLTRRQSTGSGQHHFFIQHLNESLGSYWIIDIGNSPTFNPPIQVDKAGNIWVSTIQSTARHEDGTKYSFNDYGYGQFQYLIKINFDDGKIGAVIPNGLLGYGYITSGGFVIDDDMNFYTTGQFNHTITWGNEVFTDQCNTVTPASNNGFVNKMTPKPATGGGSRQFEILISRDNLELEVFPNPTTDILQIRTEQAFALQVLDTRGVVIQTFNLENTPAEIDVRTWKSGAYFLVFQTENQSFIRQIIKK